MATPLKYTKEQIEEFLVYAKSNDIGIMKMLKVLNINRRTFYMSAYRFNVSTDSARKSQPFNTKAMTISQVEEVLKYAEANRVSHKKACSNFSYCYSTFRGALVRLHVKAERFSSTYSKEVVQEVFNYALAKHVSLKKACLSAGHKYNLITASAKRHGIKLERNTPIFEEAKSLPEKEAVGIYLEKGFGPAEIFHAFKKMDRRISRGMVYYYAQHQRFY